MDFIQKKKDLLKSKKEGIGIISKFINSRDSVHVGIFWNWDGDQEAVHFVSDNSVLLEKLSEKKFDSYWFTLLPDFEEKVIDSLIAVAEIISENKKIDLKLDLTSVVYNGGKFDLKSGDFLIDNKTETIINCGIFTIALLETYDYNLINWETWPCVTASTRSRFLDDWLDDMGVKKDKRGPYYNCNKEIRGMHILTSSESGNSKTEFSELDAKCEPVMDFLRTNPLF